MATKSKLEQAVEKQASDLNEAQKELVKSQFSEYKKNKDRIMQIDDLLGVPVVAQSPDSEKAKIQIANRMALTSERSQLVSTNNELASTLFNQLSDVKE